MNRDLALLFVARMLRMAGFGAVTVILLSFLETREMSTEFRGWILSGALVGDVVLTLLLATRADRWGRRRTLALTSLVLTITGILFAYTTSAWALLLIAIVGVLSPMGNEVGPFLSVEHAALTQIASGSRRNLTFSAYSLAGSLAAAMGSFAAGQGAMWLIEHGYGEAGAGRAVLLTYAACGAAMAVAFLTMSPQVEPEVPGEIREGKRRQVAAARKDLQHRFGVPTSAGIVLSLALLFALDAFAGGFVAQSFLSGWAKKTHGFDYAARGNLFFVFQILAGISQLLAAPLANRFGLINTMVFTHLPSNLLLLAVPFAPDRNWAMGLLIARFSLSQMDVPTRQAYVVSVVPPSERSAAAGITGTARSVGVALAPPIASVLYANPAWVGTPFFIAGALKIIYDLLLYRAFISQRAEHEK